MFQFFYYKLYINKHTYFYLYTPKTSFQIISKHAKCCKTIDNLLKNTYTNRS